MKAAVEGGTRRQQAVALAHAEPALWALVGNTPLIPLPPATALDRPLPPVLLKAEWLNPGGSVKDRAALFILRDGIAQGALPGKRLLDASSGNTAIAYAMLGAARGIGVTVCVPANASAERKALLEAFGAEVVFTDPLEGSDGAIRAARGLAARRPDDFWYADQYNHPANPRAHYLTTAEELWRQTEGRITHFVAGLGTTGTMVGAGRRLKELNAAIELVAVQPDEPGPDGVRCHGAGGGHGARAGAGDGVVRGLVHGRGAGGCRARVDRPRQPSTALDRRRCRHRSRLGAAVPERAPPTGGGGGVTLVLEPRHVTAIRQHGEADYPYEACGLIGGLADGSRLVAVQLVPLPNARSDAARNRYLIDPAVFRRAQLKLDRDGLEIIGVYHSHPDHPPIPSQYDRDHAWPRLVYVIAAVAGRKAGDLEAWVLLGHPGAFDAAPLIIEERTVAWQSRS